MSTSKTVWYDSNSCKTIRKNGGGGLSSDRDILEKAARNALKMMRGSGFEISDRLEVMLDPELPFMGYATQRRGGHVIVVSGMALKSGLVEGLLIHEMCHVYRTDTGHPSHKNHVTEPYQIRVIQQAVNHIQDLYSDDIAFKVFDKTAAFPPEQIHNFFLTWITDTPITPRNTRERWLNVGIMLNNCFAISNLTRHNVRDIDNKAQNKIQRYLSQVDDQTKREFTHFKNLMTNLKEDTDEKQFHKDLAKYLTRIIELAR